MYITLMVLPIISQDEEAVKNIDSRQGDTEVTVIGVPAGTPLYESTFQLSPANLARIKDDPKRFQELLDAYFTAAEKGLQKAVRKFLTEKILAGVV